MAGDPPRSSEPNRGQRSGRRELVNTRPADGESLSDLFGREEELARASPVWAVARARRRSPRSGAPRVTISDDIGLGAWVLDYVAEDLPAKRAPRTLHSSST